MQDDPAAIEPTKQQREDWIEAYKRDDAERKARAEAEAKRRADAALADLAWRSTRRGHDQAMHDTAGVQFTNLWDLAVNAIIERIIEAAKKHVPAHALPEYLRSLKGRHAPRISMSPRPERRTVVTTVVVPEIVVGIETPIDRAQDSGRRDITRRSRG